MLVVDDTVLDKPHAHHMQLVSYQWSGRHGAVARGIGLVTLLWTDGDRLYPTDYRAYCKASDGRTKNDHCREMLAEARRRGFAPRCVLFDRWYSGLENLKAVRALGWRFLAPVAGNRLVRLGGGRPERVDRLAIAAGGTAAWLPGFGEVKVFRVVARDGGTEHWVTNDPSMGEPERQELDELSWSIEEYHRGLKQHCGAERCQARYHAGEAEPHRAGGAGVRAAGVASVGDRDQLVRGEDAVSPPPPPSALPDGRSRCDAPPSRPRGRPVRAGPRPSWPGSAAWPGPSGRGGPGRARRRTASSSGP